MRRRSLGALLVLALAVNACANEPTPAPSELPGGACAEDLPVRTSPTDHPLAILHLAGDDLPPVIGEVEWRGGDEPVETTAPRPVHLERFTVLQARGVTELSIRLTDERPTAAWRVIAIPDNQFRAGETESGTEWSRGDEPAPLVCVQLEDGAWAIRADLTFADDAGHGTFYWRVNVSETASG
jgi:hypothetical protein